MGGGNIYSAPDISTTSGLSPRGRGKRVAGGQKDLQGGSIPAWAGETIKRKTAHIRIWVYPRVGGGNVREHGAQPVHAGLSPRGRGKHGRR